ncbi:hypothetical protein ACFVYG_22380 [Streptomyces sp. NPDC058256]|uniref:hypothetical protein n=1 Tax=Streptomyces sp. NPDC058256 TaxID=3346408 RepID=UPI0036EC1E2C
MLKYTLPVHEHTAQHAHLASVPDTTNDYQDPAVDDPRNPTRITVYAPGEAAALRIAQRHLTLLHARLAYTDPDNVTRTAADTVYAQARARAETLTSDQREDESMYAIHSENQGLMMDALTDVMYERGELPS